MTPYVAMKTALIKAWPYQRVLWVAQAVMQGMQIECRHPSGNTDMEKVIQFMKSLNMPKYIGCAVTMYIATYYPKTSAALYDGQSKDVALSIFFKEKKLPIHRGKGFLSQDKEIKREASRRRATRTIKARSLSKKHDWNTVK